MDLDSGGYTYFSFYNMVRLPGTWDYKSQNTYQGQFDAFGNFNFGATGAALGIPLDVLVRVAG